MDDELKTNIDESQQKQSSANGQEEHGDVRADIISAAGSNLSTLANVTVPVPIDGPTSSAPSTSAINADVDSDLPKNPACEEIKRRSSSSHKRTYRQSYRLIDSPDTPDSNDGGATDTVNEESSHLREGEGDPRLRETGGPLEKDAFTHNECSNDVSQISGAGDLVKNAEACPATPMDTSGINSSVGSPDAAASIGSSNPSTSDTTTDSEDARDERIHDILRRIAVYPAGMGLEDDDDYQEPEGDFEPGREVISSSSSSSESLHFLEDEDGLEDDSSESSDSILEDLEEKPIEVKKKSNDDHDGGETAPKKKKIDQKKKQDLPSVLLKPKPKSTWSGPREIFQREIGYKGRVQSQSAEIFRSKFYGSLFSVERLELMKKLDGHAGCVNCLNFNYSGTKLASGSDDLHIKIWNYGLGQLLASFPSGHRSNVFQARFLPLVGLDNMIVSCARDCDVRLTELDSSGSVGSCRLLAHHHGPAHKLTINPENPQVILSCGEDGVVFNIDIREEHPQRILRVREKQKKVALYSIHGNPLMSHEFCVTGRDEYVRIYDARKLSTITVGTSRNERDVTDSSENDNQPPVKRFCPHHLQESRSKSHVTAAVYNYNGKEILGSYNDENIYLFDATHSDMADCIKVYEGHRNSATVKGVNFFGDRSQYVVSGSDCGHVFIWHKETESIVNFFRGDENGVVNCLEPHPTAPILATSGLDDDVKIWIPSSETAPKMGDLTPTVKKNIKKRQEELDHQPDALDNHIMMALWSHLRAANRNGRGTDNDSDDSHDSWPNEEDDEDDEPGARGVECSIS